MAKTQKHFRRVPPALLEKARDFSNPDIVVSCSQSTTAQDIQSGRFRHLGLEMVDGRLAGLTSSPPPAESGRYSRFNTEGRVVVRRDLPKVWKSYQWWAPNFGDSSKGEHLVTRLMEVYPREFHPPHQVELRIELLETPDEPSTGFRLKFSLDEILNPAQPDFMERLFFLVNLLQENVGLADVFPSTATRDDYLRTTSVDWEMLPVGSAERVLDRLLDGIRTRRDEVLATLLARKAFLEGLHPLRWIAGTSGFVRYFGAQFAEDLVVLENVQYGNAAYVLFENWATLSKKSRLELLADRTGFLRIVHCGDWQEKLARAVRSRLPGPGTEQIAA